MLMFAACHVTREHRFKERTANNELNPLVSADPQKQLEILIQLEAVLFATATTWQEYMDQRTLDERLRSLLAAFLKRKLNKKMTETSR